MSGDPQYLDSGQMVPVSSLALNLPHSSQSWSPLECFLCLINYDMYAWDTYCALHTPLGSRRGKERRRYTCHSPGASVIREADDLNHRMDNSRLTRAGNRGDQGTIICSFHFTEQRSEARTVKCPGVIVIPSAISSDLSLPYTPTSSNKILAARFPFLLCSSNRFRIGKEGQRPSLHSGTSV